MANDLPTASERFLNGIIPENPVFKQLLAMCPVLAVTNAMKPALTMALATGFVLVCANLLVSIIRPLLKPHLRILVFTLTIATFVTVADKLLAAYLYSMSKALGPYVPLIIANCMIISRCEICASKQSPGIAFMDAIGATLGFTLALAAIATVREILGAGTWFGLPLLGDGWPGWGIMLLPPGAFLVLGLLLGISEYLTHMRAKGKGPHQTTTPIEEPAH